VEDGEVSGFVLRCSVRRGADDFFRVVADTGNPPARFESFEMSIFGAIMNYAVKKRYVPASQRFDERPKLKTMRRDGFTLEEYRKLHTVGRNRPVSSARSPSP
jgi:hypothetical protein